MFKNRNRGRKGKNTSMENMYELIAPCHFGLESVLKREILDLGYEIVTVEDGRITFRGDVTAIARANIFIRTAERILLKMGSFRATDFDELFEGTKAIPWEEFLPRDAKFWVTKATTNKSALFSASAIQSIVKKAIVERMKQTYRVERFEEDGDEYPIRVFIFKDQVSIGLDTSGTSLPQNGSTSTRSLFHGVSIRSAAASVSEIGAFPTSVRYPRLCSDVPDVSRPIDT